MSPAGKDTPAFQDMSTASNTSPEYNSSSWSTTATPEADRLCPNGSDIIASMFWSMLARDTRVKLGSLPPPLFYLPFFLPFFFSLPLSLSLPFYLFLVGGGLRSFLHHQRICDCRKRTGAKALVGLSPGSVGARMLGVQCSQEPGTWESISGHLNKRVNTEP